MKKSKGICRKIFSALFIVAVLIFLSVLFLIHAVFPSKYNDSILSASKKYEVDEATIRAVIWTESKYKKDAMSSKGAIGLMQLLPSTAEFVALSCAGYDSFSSDMLYEASINIDLGSCYLRYLLDRFKDEESAIAAYNAGEGNVQEWKQQNIKEIPFKETKDYVKRVALAKKIYKFKAR